MHRFLIAVLLLVPADLPPEFARLELQAVRPPAAQFRWQEVPWHTDAATALAEAKSEKRPLLVWLAGGRDRDGTPLERC